MTDETSPRTATDRAPGPLTVRTYLGYAAGDAANNLSFTMASLFLILYYTNVVGVEGAVIGTMFLVIRAVDAVADLVAGRLVDAKQPGRLGKFKPFILWFSLPLLVSSWAIYSARVWFPDLSGGAAILYMYLTYLVMGLFYSMVNIPYGSMAPSITQNPSERGKLATFRMYGTAIAILALAFVVSPQIRGNADDPEALQRSLFLTTGVMVLVGMALYLFLIFNTEERVHRDPAPVSLRDSLATLRTNTPLLWLAAGSVLFLTGFTVLSTLTSYVAIYVQENAQFIAWNMLGQTAALFAVGPFIPLIVRTVGKRTGYLLGGVVTIVGALVLMFTPLSDWPWLGVVAFFLMGMGIYGVNTLMWALEADTVEYGEWRTGHRTEGTTYAVFSFTRKVGQALGGFFGGLALTWAGFSADRASSGQAQEDGVAGSIQLLTGGLLLVAAVASIAVMFFYPLTEEKFRQISSEIAARRARRVQPEGQPAD